MDTSPEISSDVVRSLEKIIESAPEITRKRSAPQSSENNRSAQHVHEDAQLENKSFSIDRKYFADLREGSSKARVIDVRNPVVQCIGMAVSYIGALKDQYRMNQHLRSLVVGKMPLAEDQKRAPEKKDKMKVGAIEFMQILNSYVEPIRNKLRPEHAVNAFDVLLDFESSKLVKFEYEIEKIGAEDSVLNIVDIEPTDRGKIFLIPLQKKFIKQMTTKKR